MSRRTSSAEFPEVEVDAARTDDFAKFGVNPDSVFEPERPAYLAFRESIDARSAIKSTLEADPARAWHPHPAPRRARILVDYRQGRLRPTPACGQRR